MADDLDAAKRTTRLSVIEAAESLFAQFGPEGVSLREIGKAAGSANTNVVRYYFGGKDELIQAVFDHRLHAMEVARTRLLTAMAEQKRIADPRALLEVILRPFADQKNSKGLHSYAAFLLGLDHVGQMSRRLSASTPASDEAVRLLAATFPHLSPAQFHRRMRLISLMFITGLTNLDKEGAGARRTRKAELLSILLPHASGYRRGPAQR
jgi:AcrR family transcriptional regulator